MVPIRPRNVGGPLYQCRQDRLRVRAGPHSVIAISGGQELLFAVVRFGRRRRIVDPRYPPRPTLGVG